MMRKSSYIKEEQKAKTATHELHSFSFFISFIFIYLFIYFLRCFILIKFQEEIRRQLREWEKVVVGPLVGRRLSMVVAFMTGLYAVLPLSSGLPIVTCIICCIVLLAFYFVFRQLFKFIKES